MKTSKLLAAGFLFLFLAGIFPAQAATKTWTGAAGTNDWFVAGNWNAGAGPAPVAGDDVVIATAGASVLLTNSTPPLSSLILSNSLVFSNWDTKLSATNVTILTNGVMTLPGAFTNSMMSNNVYVICSNITINGGGKIDVDGRGYAGGTNSGGSASRMIGSGPGFGSLYAADYGGGGAYGGWAAKNGGQGGVTYGSATNPLAPGSGACSGYSATGNHNGGAGGGAVRIEATGTTTINGTITANGAPGGIDWVGGGAGSGGGILIRCLTLQGITGVIRANGGTSAYTGSGAGGGGRIAVFYDLAAQNALPLKPSILFTVLPGSLGVAADIGTLYFPDTYFLSETLGTNFAGQVAGLTTWSPNSLTISNTWVRFPEEGFQLMVTNRLTITGSAGKLEMGGGTLVTNRDFYYLISVTSGPAITVGQDLVVTNGGSLTVYACMTNATVSTGAVVTVSNLMQVLTGSWVYAVSHYTNGGSACFRMKGMVVETNAGFNANYKGFAGGIGYGGIGYGPGKGPVAPGDYSSGAGYGGSGGRGTATSAGGTTYGSVQLPIDPGSGGAGGNGHGGWGGGVIRIEAAEDVVMNGSLSANGEIGAGINPGGSGGGIYVACRSITGTNSVISAVGGGGGTPSNAGGGGGGRIAINYNTTAQSALPVPSIVFSCASGQGYMPDYQGADVGTLWLPDNRFLVETLPHSAQWIVPIVFTNWSPNRLCISNGWIRFPFDAFVLTVTNEVTVVGANANFNKLEVSKLTCGSVGLTNGSLIIKGYTTMPSLTCTGTITATNSTLALDASSTTGSSFTCGSSLSLKNGSSFYVYSGKTNGAVGTNGALITVGGDLLMASNVNIYSYSQSTNGGSPYFQVGSLTMAKGATINADGKGYGGAYYTKGNGPGGGSQEYTSAGGGGYGGRGGQGLVATDYGPTYGASNAPTAPGSAGGAGYNGLGGRGGGLVLLRTTGTLTLDGTITANGTFGNANYMAGGSGGGIYLTCKTLAGTTGTLSAKGGNSTTLGTSGGGGGGRIAIWRVRGDPSVFSYNVTNGVGTYVGDNAAVGTIFWGQLPVPGAIISVY